MKNPPVLRLLRVFWRMRWKKATFLSFNVTNVCNERCLMCSVWRLPTEELTLPEIEKLFLELKRRGIMVVEISGGEPFVRKDIVEILRMLDRQGFLLTITTNGTLLSPSLVQELNELKGLVQVAISLDSLDRELYARLRGADMLPVVLKNLDSLRLAHPSFPLKINLTLSRLNYLETPAMLDFVKERGLFLSVFPATRGTGFHHRGDDPALEPDDDERQKMAEVFEKLVHLRKAGEPLWEYSRFYRLAAEYVLGKPVGMCDAGTLYLDLHPDGTLASCIDQDSCGNLAREDVSEVFARLPLQREKIVACAGDSPCCYTCTFNLSITANHIVSFAIETLRMRITSLFRGRRDKKKAYSTIGGKK